MKKKESYKRYPRRVLSKKNYCVPDQSLSIRTLIDRVSKGLPVNAKLSKHIPLPQDGQDMNDFVTGTEEIVDVVDAVEHMDRIRSEMKYIQEQKQKQADEAIGKVESPPVDNA